MQLPWLGPLLVLARPVAIASCSGEQDNCIDTKCCEDEGFSCFQKNDEFAACRVECEPGVHEDDAEDFQTPWSCNQLEADEEAARFALQELEPQEEAVEPQAKCSGLHEDCRSTGCCADPSMKCYEKNEEWATCMEVECEPGEHEDDPKDLRTPWSCRRPDAFCVVDAFQQCGGRGLSAKAPRCCKPGCRCDSSFEGYHQCLPISDSAVSCEEAVSNDSAGGASADEAMDHAVVRLASTREESAQGAWLGRPGAEAARGRGVAAAIAVGCGVMAAIGVGLFARRGALQRPPCGAPRVLLPQDMEVE
jgi:hypothetical protein